MRAQDVSVLRAAPESSGRSRAVAPGTEVVEGARAAGGTSTTAGSAAVTLANAAATLTAIIATAAVNANTATSATATGFP